MNCKNVFASLFAAGLLLLPSGALQLRAGEAPSSTPNAGNGSTPSSRPGGPAGSLFGGRLRFSGMLQGGYFASYGVKSPLTAAFPGGGANDFNLHRLIFIVNADITDKLTVTYNGNFVGGYSNLEFYATYRFAPEFQVQFGQKKIPLTMDNQFSPAVSDLIATGSFVTNYFVAGDASNPLTGAWGGRDLGMEVRGDLFHNLLSYRLGVYNGQGINVRDKNKAKDLSGSLTLRPFKGMELQGSFYEGTTVAVGTALFEAGGSRIQAGDEYRRSRFAASAAYSSDRFGVRSEYISGRDGAVRSDGVYVTARAELRDRLELICSYAYGDFNKGEASHLVLNNYIAGLQYWFLPKCRIRLEYSLMDLPGKGNLNHTLTSQLQFAF